VTRDPVQWPTADLLAHRVAATPGREALVDADAGERWSYRDLDGRVDRMAGALAAAGVAPGDRVGLLADTRPAFAAMVHAAARLRVTLVPFNAALTAAELRPQVARTGVAHLVCTADTEAPALDVAGDAGVLTLDDPYSREVDALDDGGALPDRDPLSRDHPLLVLFTSGTTGAPKGVRLTAGNLVASATASAFRLGVAPGDRWLVCLPMYHMGGLAPVVRSALYGTTAVVQRSFDAEATGRAIAERDVTGVSLVPTMLGRMLDAGWTPPDRLRFVLLGGAPARDSLVERCEARGVPVHPTYGTTETASQIATATPQQAFDHGGTVGQPLVTTSVTVVDGAGDPVPPGETGELVVDGPTVTPGYLDDDRTEAAFGPHGLHTGDVGYRDDDGRLWVLGRTDDAIVTGGENVHPSQVADAVRDHPGVADVAVVGLEDPEWGERVGALVVGDAALADVETHCRERLAGFKVPKTWDVAEALPRTASGTVDREAVRELLRD
jgi:O-succinylbenzoic acid--CoA ligase